MTDPTGDEDEDEELLTIVRSIEAAIDRGRLKAARYDANDLIRALDERLEE